MKIRKVWLTISPIIYVHILIYRSCNNKFILQSAFSMVCINFATIDNSYFKVLLVWYHHFLFGLAIHININMNPSITNLWITHVKHLQQFGTFCLPFVVVCQLPKRYGKWRKRPSPSVWHN